MSARRLLAACCTVPGCCSSRSPATPGSRRSAKRYATRPVRSRERSRWLARRRGRRVRRRRARPAARPRRRGARQLDSPLRRGSRRHRPAGLAPVLQVVVVVAAGGALLSLTLGVSRTMLAMARDRHLPRALATAERPRASQRRAAASARWSSLLVLLGDLGTSIAFSSFCVLLYYAITNAAAWTLSTSWWHRAVPRSVCSAASCWP